MLLVHSVTQINPGVIRAASPLPSRLFGILQTNQPWITIGISLGAGLIVVFIIYSILLRRLVHLKTIALQESEAKFRHFFMNSQDPAFITTKDGKWVECNDAIIHLFGYDNKEELLQTHVSQIYFDPLERPAILNQIDRNGFVRDLPVDMVDRHGNPLHVVLTACTISDSEGEITGYQGTIRDNSADLISRHNLRRSQESLDLAFTGTGAGMWDWNIQSNIIEINDRWADIIGYQKSELTPLTIDDWEKLSHPQDLEKSNKLILMHFAGDIYHYQTEMRMRHKKGHWVWILNQGRVVERDRDRSPLRMVGTTQDITDRVKIREEIQEYANQLEALYEVSQSLSSTLPLKELLQLILDKLSETLSFDSASIFLLEGDTLKTETVLNHPHPDLVLGKTFPAFNPLFQEIKETKKPIIIDNAKRDSRFQAWGQTHHVKGWMGVPLVFQDTLIGYITLDSREISAFGTPEARLANLFASQAAQAIQNARLFEKVTQYAETLESRIDERTRELSKMVEYMAGREIRMAELKEVIQQLQEQLAENGLKPEAQDPLKDWDFIKNEH